MINYEKTNWRNGSGAPINAANLNKIEQGVKDACDGVDSLQSACPFPVNSIYMSMDSANPSTIWGDTIWQRISQGKVLVGVDENDTDFADGASGGAKGAWRHGHGHNYGRINWINTENTTRTLQVGSNAVKTGTASGQAKVDVNNTTVADNGSTNNTLPVDIANMPPYMTCYIWQRTA